MKVALVGATGLVGRKMLQVLEERNFPVTELLPVASEKSVGRKVPFGGKEWTVMRPEDALAAKPALALFSAGGAVSQELAPKFAAIGCRVVDNSSFWRMDPGKKLVVPEINGDVLGPDDYIIANPNCSTIQMVMALAPPHREFGIKDKQIIGILTGIVRDGKTILVTDKKYLFYVHLWCDFFHIRVIILAAKQFAHKVKRSFYE